MADGEVVELLKHEDLTEEQRREIGIIVENIHTFLHAVCVMSGHDPQLVALGFVRWLGCTLYEMPHRDTAFAVFKQNLDRIPEYWVSRAQQEANDGATTKH